MILLNGTEIKPTIFPDKTSQIWKIDESLITRFTTVTWVFKAEREFIYLAQLVTLLQSHDVLYKLELPYLPYGRQDKKVSNDTTFALHTFAALINSLKFEGVIIRDAHSDVALKLINYSSSYFLDSHITNLVEGYDTLCFPDKGACDRYSKLFKSHNIVTGSKVRDQSTGYIKEFTFNGNVKDRHILLIDDICDGGMTFRILAKDLLKNGAEQVDLYVSHGIFSKGLDVLYNDGITNIFTPEGKQ